MRPQNFLHPFFVRIHIVCLCTKKIVPILLKTEENVKIKEKQVRYLSLCINLILTEYIIPKFTKPWSSLMKVMMLKKVIKWTHLHIYEKCKKGMAGLNENIGKCSSKKMNFGYTLAHIIYFRLYWLATCIDFMKLCIQLF